MYIYLTIALEVNPRYRFLGRRLIGQALDKTGHWKTYFVKKRDKGQQKEIIHGISEARVVVVGADVMNMCTPTYTALCPAMRASKAKIIVIMGDLRPSFMQRAALCRPNLLAGTNGYLHKTYTAIPEVYIPQSAILQKFCKDPKLQAFIPLHHGCVFKGLPTLSRATFDFYVQRRQLCMPLKDHPKVVFQSSPIYGQAYLDTLRNHLVCVCAVPCPRYPNLVGKLTEIMAGGSLLIADTRPYTHVFASLGFVDKVHYFEATPETIVACVNFSLNPDNRETIDTMRHAAHHVVANSHRPIHRIPLMDRLCKIVLKE